MGYVFLFPKGKNITPLICKQWRVVNVQHKATVVKEFCSLG